MEPWKYGTIPGQRAIYKRPKKTLLPHLLLPPQSEKRRFVTEGFDIPDAFTAKTMFARDGMNKPEMYALPKPHDFRAVSTHIVKALYWI